MRATVEALCSEPVRRLGNSSPGERDTLPLFPLGRLQPLQARGTTRKRAERQNERQLSRRHLVGMGAAVASVAAFAGKAALLPLPIRPRPSSGTTMRRKK